MSYKNVIVRMPNWIGDVVMATPILNDLHAKWPEAKITAMCQGATCHLLTHHPHLNEVFTFSRPNEFLRRQEKRNLIERLRQGHYDLGILLTNSFSSAWWFWRGHVERRIGYTGDWRRPLLTDPLPFPLERGKEHLVTTYKRLLTPLGIPPSQTKPKLYVTKTERDAAMALLKLQHVPEGAQIVGINPGAAYGSAKCWLPERFRAVIERLLQKEGRYIVCFGDAAGAPLVKEICGGLPPRVINLAGLTSIRELMALIAMCDAFLTNDSGPMHIGAALGTPLVALFGSTNEVATGPFGHGTVIHKHVKCSPCYKRTCPIDFRCMTRIEVDEVYEEVEKAISTRSASKEPG